MEKVEKMKEQMGSVSRETETLRNQKEIPEIKNSNGKDECLWWGISRLDPAKERVSRLEDMWIQTSQTDLKTEKKKI